MRFIKDGLFGLAIGEAFGVQLDMEEPVYTSPVTTMQDNRAYECPIGTFSDDTCMLLASLDSYIRNDLKENLEMLQVYSGFLIIMD